MNMEKNNHEKTELRDCGNRGGNKNEDALVSIIVPVYCAKEHLHECVMSIIKQIYVNIEILLVDDGSPDECGSMCDEYTQIDERVKVIHQENKGVSAARNAGTLVAKGEYIAFVDADDYIKPDCIYHMLTLICQTHADIAVCACENARKRNDNKTKCLSKEEALKQLLYQKSFDTSPWSKLYRAQIVKENPFPEGMFFEDLAVVCRMFGAANKIVLSGRKTYCYRHNPNGTMNSRSLHKLLDEIKAADMMYEYVIDNFPNLSKAATSRRFSAYCQVLAKLPSGQNEDSKKIIKQKIKDSRISILFDGEARIKNRLAAIITIFGEGPLRYLWRISR